MTTLEDVQDAAGYAHETKSSADHQAAVRDLRIQQCYNAGNATLKELAKATGLSKQRVWQIVGEG